MLALAVLCLVGGVTSWRIHHGSFYREALHPAPLQIAKRPASVILDPPRSFPERGASQVAILLTNSEPRADSPARCLQAMGIPFFVTRDVSVALRHKLVVLYPGVDGKTFDDAQARQITAFVARGGVIFAQNVLWGGFKPLFGFDDVVALRTRHKISLAAADPLFQYLNRPEEKEIPLGSPALPEVIWSNGYRPSPGTQSLARFDDGATAMLRHDVGQGHAYLIGVALNDVVLRDQQNRDYEAQRIYANGFEPGSDVWPLILRAWYENYSDSGLRLATIPGGKRSVLMISHDVDWEHSFQPMLAFAAFEKETGISSTFFVQTKYLDDATSRAFFFGPSLDVLRQLIAGHADIGSHTVIHSELFNKVPLGSGEEKYPTYTAHATRDDAAKDATTLGEVCVSKSLLDGELQGHQTIFFRAGHLRVPPYLPEALMRCGYEFDSSFTAGDVLTNFPYELDYDLGLTEPTTIFEFPVTFEDEELPPLLERVPAILQTIEANAENGAASVILIHTNNAKGKLDAERALVSHLPKDILVGSMTEYARFWKARSRLHWIARPVTDGEQVEIDTDLPIAGLTLESRREIRAATGVAEVHWIDHQVILPSLASKSHVTLLIQYLPKPSPKVAAER
jgi:hypothetical protein